MRNILLLIWLLVAIIPLNSAEPLASRDASQVLVTSVRGRDCRHGLQHQPNGPFALIAFCEDAVGTYLAVICYDKEGCEKSIYPDGTIRFAGWENGKRVWQEKPWTEDVNSIAWSPDGKSLFIATSEIYGAGGLYQLNLEERKAKQLLPPDYTVSRSKPGPGYAIVSINQEGSLLTYRFDTDESRGHFKNLTLPIQSPEGVY